MPNLLEQLPGGQQKAVMIGVPVVAVFALIATIRKPKVTPAAADAKPAGISGFVMPSTDAIGTGQLAEFESLLTARINNLSVQTDDLATGVGSLSVLVANPPALPIPLPPPPAPAPEYTPAPPPVQAAPAPCSPPAGWPGLSGEMIIKRLDAPGGGCWYITNFGGVANVGGAPNRGSCLANNNACRMGPGYENPPRYVVDAANSGSGYVMYSNRGEVYTF